MVIDHGSISDHTFINKRCFEVRTRRGTIKLCIPIPGGLS